MSKRFFSLSMPGVRKSGKLGDSAALILILALLPLAQAQARTAHPSSTARAQYLADSTLTMYFAEVADSTQIFYNEDPQFLVMVYGDAKDTTVVDTVHITLTTGQGDSETVAAIETGPASGEFIAAVPMRATAENPVPGDSIVEIDGSTLGGDTVVLDALVEWGGLSDEEEMELGIAGDLAIAPRARPRSRQAAMGAKGYSIDGRKWIIGLDGLSHPRAILISP